MKKIRLLSLLLVLVLTVTLFAACRRNRDTEETKYTYIDPNNVTIGTQPTYEITYPDYTLPDLDLPDMETLVPTEPEPSQPEPTEPESDDPNALTIGTWNGSTYINKYIGFQITFDNSWTLATAKDLQQLSVDTQELFSGTIAGEILKNLTQLMDMQATNVLNGNTVNVVYQKNDASLISTYQSLTEEQIIDLTLLSKDMMIQSYAAAGIQVSSMEKVKVNFLGQSHYAVKTTASMNGVPVYYLQLMRFDLGLWSTTVTVMTVGSDTTQAMLNKFQPA